MSFISKLLTFLLLIFLTNTVRQVCCGLVGSPAQKFLFERALTLHCIQWCGFQGCWFALVVCAGVFTRNALV
uniref:Secreted protein n=1 Tax=Anguilla anguilla TaxID=7936 RepID=A0A0E9UK21_ANGAN